MCDALQFECIAAGLMFTVRLSSAMAATDMQGAFGGIVDGAGAIHGARLLFTGAFLACLATLLLAVFYLGLPEIKAALATSDNEVRMLCSWDV